MPRQAREKSKTGIYHVMVRGIGKKNIFHDKEDYFRYLDNLDRVKKKSEFKLYGYCLMRNHIHLLIQEVKEDISLIMKRVGVSYAGWYNRKYQRTGHVFQDRYKSECVEDETYLITVLRYIHQNPVKAGQVKKPEQHRWSSCHTYYGEDEYSPGLTDCQQVLDLFGNHNKIARKCFKVFTNTPNNDECLDEDEEQKRLSDGDLRREIEKILGSKNIFDLHQMDKKEQKKILGKTKEIQGATIRQIARVTGLSTYIVHKA